MKLRRLEQKDAERMLAWMHDKSVVEHMGTDFSKKSYSDCVNFIVKSQNDKFNLHMAVVDDNDVYMGTVSLKNIELDEKRAEFAITVSKEVMGKGYSIYAMREIINIAFTTLGLEEVYWYVAQNNQRAVRFYDKHKFERISTPKWAEPNDLYYWYHVRK